MGFLTKNNVFVVGCTVTLCTIFGTSLYAATSHTPFEGNPQRILVSANTSENTVELLAKTIWGEARNQGEKGMKAVCYVVLNRKGSRPTWGTLRKVVKAPHQFSVWNTYDNNYKLIRKGVTHKKSYKKALQIARECLYKPYEDITKGATHYHAAHKTPFWAAALEKTVVIGDHIFYREGS